MIKTVTPEIERAQAELDTFGNAHFPNYHSVTDDYEYSLYSTVSREFDVAELMTGLGIEVAPEYEYRPSPFVETSDRIDYAAAYALTSTPEYWESREVSDFPKAVAEYGEEAVNRGICILQDSSCMGELLCDYFAMEAVSETDAAAKISEYMRLLDQADQAYRAAGWEL